MRPIVRNSRIYLASFGLISSLFVIGCGSKDASSGAAPCTPFDYTKYTPTSTSVSLANDLAPIMKTCAKAKTCHGATGVSPADNEPQLGPISGFVGDMMGAAKVQMALVGKPSAEAPTMSYVVAGKPEDSWMMKKLEGSQNCVTGVTCTKVAGDMVPSPCGDNMPSMSDALSPEDVQKFRDWIKAGAAAM
jgi:hypothetical protein